MATGAGRPVLADGAAGGLTTGAAVQARVARRRSGTELPAADGWCGLREAVATRRRTGGAARRCMRCADAAGADEAVDFELNQDRSQM